MDEHNKIMRSVLEPVHRWDTHTHETSSEIIYVLQGSGKVLYDDGEERVESGVCHYCPKGTCTA